MGYTKQELEDFRMNEALGRPGPRMDSMRSYAGGILGYCPRCQTDGPCREATCDYDYTWDWEPGLTCGDRPFANKAWAYAMAESDYYSVGCELYWYWTEDGTVRKLCGKPGKFKDVDDSDRWRPWLLRMP